MDGLIKKIKEVESGDYVYPVTVADAVFVAPDQSLVEKLAELEAAHVSGKGVYYVDLARFRITEGSFGKPPYTPEQWQAAYTNILGINEALRYAAEHGYAKVVLPRGTYSVCYTNLNGGATIAQMVHTPIRMPSNLTLDLNGSTIEVMYDSLNKNPFDLSPPTTEPWRLSGKVIEFKDCVNAHIRNGTIIGDIPNRSFSDGGTGFNSERGMEQTYGILFGEGARFCSAKNLNISMFMGDGICLDSLPSRTGDNWMVVPSNPTHYPGYIDDTGTIVPQAGAYVTNAYPIDPTEFKQITLRSGGGYTRIVPFKNRVFQYVFLDENGAVVRRVNGRYLQTVVVPHNATHLRIQVLNEEPDLPSLNINYMVTRPQASFIEISGCEIHDNHRGGISGGSDFTYIGFNRIYNNGQDSGIGVPIFPDSTRYAINFEDNYANFLIIENNYIYSHFNGLLLGVYHAEVTGNVFFGSSGVVVYNNHVCYVRNNVFLESPGLVLQSTSAYEDRTIYFDGNTVETAGSLNFNATDRTTVHLTNNRFKLMSANVQGNVIMTGNVVCDLGEKTGYTQIVFDGKMVVGNTFEGFGSGPGYGHRFFVGKRDGSDACIRGNVFRDVEFSGTAGANEVEYYDSEFYRCVIQGKHADKTKDSVVRLVNCYLSDSRIEHQGVFINDASSAGVGQRALLSRCRITFTEAFGNHNLYTFLDNVQANIELGRHYGLKIEDSELELKSDQITVHLINNLYSTAAMSRADVTNTVFRAADPSKLKLCRDIVHSSAYVDDCTYEGFDELVLPVNAYVVVDRKYASEPGRGMFRAGDVVYNKQPQPGDYVGWVCVSSGTAANTPWAPLTAYAFGDTVFAGNAVYRCAAAGTSGSTAPSHTSGTAQDGTVTWAYVGPRAQFKAFGAVAL
jgi:hypothetical protein